MAVTPCGPGGEPTPAPAPTQPASTDIPTGQFSATSVVPPDSPFAADFVVSGSSSAYFFAPNAVLTRSGGNLIVRGYDSLFVFPSAGVTLRTLSTTSPIAQASLPAESSGAVLNMTASPARTTVPSGDACADCSYPVIQGIDQVGLDSEGDYISAQSKPPSTAYSTCGSTSPCGPYASDSIDTTTQATYAQTASSGDPCPMSGFVYSTTSGTCVASATTPIATASSSRAPNAARHLRMVSGGSATHVRDYVWSFWGRRTSMVMDDPAPNQLLDADTYYRDVFGGYAQSHWTHLLFGNARTITMTTAPTYTTLSISEVWFGYSSAGPGQPGRFLGNAYAVYARMIW
jgi:hypothetical protein